MSKWCFITPAQVVWISLSDLSGQNTNFASFLGLNNGNPRGVWLVGLKKVIDHLCLPFLNWRGSYMISRALAWLQSGLERQISFVPSPALIIDYWSKAHLSCHCTGGRGCHGNVYLFAPVGFRWGWRSHLCQMIRKDLISCVLSDPRCKKLSQWHFADYKDYIINPC